MGRGLRQEPSQPALTVVAMTECGQAEDCRHSHEASFDHHLVKPVRPDEVLTLLTTPAADRG